MFKSASVTVDTQIPATSETMPNILTLLNVGKGCVCGSSLPSGCVDMLPANRYLFIYSLREVVFIKQLADMRCGKIAIVYSVHRVLGVSQVCSATGKYVACLRRTR